MFEFVSKVPRKNPKINNLLNISGNRFSRKNAVDLRLSDFIAKQEL